MARMMRVFTHNSDGSVTDDSFDPGEEFWAKMDADLEKIKEMEESGELIGWCKCENRLRGTRYFDNRPTNPDYRGPEHEEPRAGGSHGWLCNDCDKVTQIG